MSGRRNEPARARRRRTQKEQLSQISPQRSRVGHPRLTLSNHFGWRVLYKTQLDDSASVPLLNLYEKPDSTGSDFQKVTYVVYMDKGEAIDRETAMKHTQTESPGILKERRVKTVSKATLPPKEPEEESVHDTRSEASRSEASISEASRSETESVYEQPKPTKKRKLIYDFYYRPRSKSKPKSKNKAGDLDPAYPPLETYLSEIVTEERESEEEEKQEREEKNKEKKKRGKPPDRWALRAGAENTANKLKYANKADEGKFFGAVRTESKLIERLKYDPVKYGRKKPSEHLLQSSSGANHFLYVTTDSRKKRIDKAQ